MSKLLELAIEKVRELPETEQDVLARAMLEFAEHQDSDDWHLTEEQQAEIDRRLAEENPEVLTLEEAQERFRRRGML